jgi:hypothetical protein
MRHEYRGKGGYLPRSANFVAKPESPSFEGAEIAWKAGTLPTELLPLKRLYSIPMFPPSQNRGPQACLHLPSEL